MFFDLTFTSPKMRKISYHTGGVMKKLLIIIILFEVSGCVKYQWVKPGATEQQELVDETECEAQSLKDLPPDNRVMTIPLQTPVIH
jgi:hypothetical protein